MLPIYKPLRECLEKVTVRASGFQSHVNYVSTHGITCDTYIDMYVLVLPLDLDYTNMYGL